MVPVAAAAAMMMVVLAAVAAAAAADSTVMHCNCSNAGWRYFLCYEIWGKSANPLDCVVATREAKGPSWIDLACTDAAGGAFDRPG